MSAYGGVGTGGEVGRRGFLSLCQTHTQQALSTELHVEPMPAIVTERVDW